MHLFQKETNTNIINLLFQGNNNKWTKLKADKTEVPYVRPNLLLIFKL